MNIQNVLDGMKRDPNSKILMDEGREFMRKTHEELWNRFKDEVSFPMKDFSKIIFKADEMILNDYNRFKRLLEELEIEFRRKSL